MTEAKKPTYSQLRRKVERLESTIAEMRATDAMRRKIDYDLIWVKVDYRHRVKHAIEILQGEDV